MGRVMHSDNCQLLITRPCSQKLLLLFFFVFLVIFLSLVFILTALMTWLVLYPGPVVGKALKLYDFSDMEFKLLLVALAALNLILCFVAEVSNDMKTWACRLWTVITP